MKLEMQQASDASSWGFDLHSRTNSTALRWSDYRCLLDIHRQLDIRIVLASLKPVQLESL
jgi:hypothetical protein